MVAMGFYGIAKVNVPTREHEDLCTMEKVMVGDFSWIDNGEGAAWLNTGLDRLDTLNILTPEGIKTSITLGDGLWTF